MASKRNKNRPLSDEDRAIWNKVAKTAVPLSSQDRNFARMLQEDTGSKEHQANAPVKKPARSLKSSSASIYQAPSPSRPPLSVGQLDFKTTKKISKGRISLDGRLDLHGMRQHEAHQALYDFIEQSFYLGKRTVLIITGKGNLGQGILRENVPRWLAEARFRTLISGFAESHQPHGGAGAIYVKIRRKR